VASEPVPLYQIVHNSFDLQHASRVPMSWTPCRTRSMLGVVVECVYRKSRQDFEPDGVVRTRGAELDIKECPSVMGREDNDRQAAAMTCHGFEDGSIFETNALARLSNRLVNVRSTTSEVPWLACTVSQDEHHRHKDPHRRAALRLPPEGVPETQLGQSALLPLTWHGWTSKFSCCRSCRFALRT